MVYSRGQLGTGSTNSEEHPVLVDALAGIKIIDIACGAWHSAAVSAFGDLYVWGWNVNGQLGRSVYKDTTVTFSSGRTERIRHKMASVFPIPQLVDLPKTIEQQAVDDKRVASVDTDSNDLEAQYEVARVFCGARHTVVQTTCGQLLACGWNRYGQLALGDNNTSDVIRFTELKLPEPDWAGDVLCGSWSTILYK